MELVKREDHWALYNEDGHKIAATIDGCNSKLSIKNCQAIELGYDLDELAEKHYNGHIKRGHTEEDSLQRKIDFTIGFVSALSILSDKKFSELDMRIAYDAGCNNIDADDNIDFQDTINSLQQTEFDVEIVMECDGIETGLCDESCTCNVFPKLDADGCIILKRI